MLPQEPIRDILRRTIFNLKFIEKRASIHDGPFQTTQLLNSFLGALAHPWERFRQSPALQKSLAQAEAEGWPRIVPEHGFENPEELAGLIRRIRNGLAHGNIEFFPGADGTISAIRLWNVPPRSAAPDWMAVIDVDSIRSFLFKFADLAEELCDGLANSEPRVA